MSYFGDKSIYSAFGEQLVAEPTPHIQIANKYQIDPSELDHLEVFEATGGSADNEGNQFRCQSGVSVGGYGVVRSKDVLAHLAGEGMSCEVTASFTAGVALSLQFAGFFSLTESVAFGYDGADFSVIHEYGGVAEVQTIQITAIPAATENCTVTLDGDAVVISITNTSVQQNAQEIKDGLEADVTVSAKWRFEQIDDTVFCISQSVGDKTGTFSFTSATATAVVTEQTAGVDKTSNNIAQADWNLSTSPFGDFDPTDINIYKIVIGYLGAANLTYSVYDPGRGGFVDVHQIEWVSPGTTDTNLGQPDMKIGWISASLGSSGTNLIVKGASTSGMTQGKEAKHPDPFSHRHSKTGIGPTLVNLFTIRNRVVYGDRFNLGHATLLKVSVENDHNKGIIVDIILNAVLGSPAVADYPDFQYVDEFNSVSAYDNSASQVVNGKVLDSFIVSAGGSESVNLESLDLEMLNEEQITIAVRTVSGIGANVSGTGSWLERK